MSPKSISISRPIWRGSFFHAVALFFLATVPLLRADSFEERAQQLRNNVTATLTTVTTSASAMEGFGAEPYFQTGQNANGNTVVNGVANGYVSQLPYPPPAAFLMPFYADMDAAVRYAPLLTAGTSNTVRTVATGIGQGLWNQGTANLTLLANTIHYLSTEVYGDGAMSDGVTHAGNAGWLAGRASSIINYGVPEFASENYGFFDLAPMLTVGQLADDSLLRRKCLMAYEMGLAQYSGYWLDGALICATGRSYPDLATPALSGLREMLDMYFGSSAHLTQIMDNRGFFAAANSYRLPSPLLNAANARSQPYVGRNQFGGNYNYTFMNQRYGLFCEEVDGYNALFSQIYGMGAMWDETDTSKYNFLWVTNPQEDAGTDQGQHTHGIHALSAQFFQNQGTMMAISTLYQTSANYYPYLLCFVPGGYQAVINDSATDGRVFLAYNENMLIALSATAPFSWSPGNSVHTAYGTMHAGDSEFRVYKSAAYGSCGLVMETALPEEFPGATPQQKLAAFRAAILQHATPQLGDAQQWTISYTDRFGNRLQKKFGGYGYVNGTNMTASNPLTFPVLDNPWMTQPNAGDLRAGDGTNASFYDLQHWQIVAGADFGLKVSASDNAVNLSWNDAGLAQTGWTVESSPDDTNFSTAALLPGNATNCAVLNLSESSWNYFRVTPTGGSAPANFCSAPAGLRVPPRTPGNFRATAASSTGITLTWSNVSATEASYVVQQSPDGVNNWTDLATLAANSTSYAAGSLATGNDYFYRVASVDAADVSIRNYSPAAGTRALASLTGTSVSEPGAFRVATVSSNSVLLTWTDLAPDAVKVIVEHSPDNSTWTVLTNNLPPTANSFADAGLAPGVTNFYRVKCNNGTSDSAYTDALLGGALALGAPLNLAAVSAAPSQIGLTWSDGSVGENGFIVEHSTDNVNWTVSATNLITGTTNWTDTGLVDGALYFYRVRAVFAPFLSPPSNVVSNRTTLLAPDGLYGANLSATSVQVFWRDNSAGENSFILQRSPDGTNWTTLAAAIPTNSTSYTDAGLPANSTWFYRVAATNTLTGVGSPFSAAASVTAGFLTTALPPGADITGTGVTGSDSFSSGVYTVTGSGYQVAGSYDTFRYLFTNWTGDGVIMARVLLMGGSSSQARAGVMFRQGLNEGSLNVGMFCTPGYGHPFSARATPAGGTTITGNGTSQSYPGWVKLVRSNGTNFAGYYSGDGYNWSLVGTAVNTMPSNAYVGIVVCAANNSALNTCTFDNVTLTTTANVVPVATLSAPASVSASTVSDTELKVSWSNRALGNNAIRVERSADNTNWVLVADNLAPLNTTYNDSTLDENQKWFFHVRAVGGANVSPPSASASATTLLHRPVNFSATTIATNQNNLSWQNTSASATGWTIARSTNNSTWVTITNLPVATMNFTDTGLAQAACYYSIIATSATNTSATTVIKSSSLLLAAPSNLATTSGLSGINLLWLDNAVNETAYSVERSPNGTNNWTVLTTNLPPNTTGFTDGTFAPATTNYYRLRCFGANGIASAYSPVAMGSTLPVPVPALLVATPGMSQVALRWGAVTNATGYNLKRATVSGGSYALVIATTNTAFTDLSVTNGTNYFYVVSAKNGALESANSAEVAATPLPAIVLLADNFLATNIDNYTNVNFNLTNRQTGALAPLTYTPSGTVQLGNPAEPHDGGNVLMCTGGYAAPNYNFNGAWSAGGLRISFDLDPNAHSDYYANVWGAINIGVSAANLNTAVNSTAPHFGVLFRADGTLQAFDSGTLLTPNEPAWTAGATFAQTLYHFDIVITDPGDGLPFNGSGGTEIDIYANGGTTPVYSYTNTANGGYTNNFINVIGDATADFDNLVIEQINPPVPPAPTGLAGVVLNGQVSLTWSGPGATGFILQRGTASGGPYAWTTNLAAANFTDTNVVLGQTYYYVVAGTNIVGTGANSAELSVTPPGPPVAKANNVTNLNLGTSWVGGSVPAVYDTAQWTNIVTGANTVALGGNLTLGALQIFNPGGTVTVSDTNTLTLAGVGLPTMGVDMSAATQDLNLNCPVSLAQNQTWFVGGNRTLTAGGAIAGAATLIKDGAGSLALNGTNSFTGSLTVNNGTVSVSSIASNSAAQPLGKGTIALAGGTLLLNSSALLASDKNITLAAGTTSTLAISQGGSSDGGINDTAGKITGSGNLIINAAAGADTITRVIMNGANDFTGTVTVNSGEFQVNDNTIGNNAPLVINSGGTLRIVSNSGTPTRSLGSLSGSGTLVGGYAANTTVSIGGLNADSIFSGVIGNYPGKSPTLALIKAGTGTLTLSGANTFTGSTAVNGGNLCLANASALGGTSGITVAGSSTVATLSLSGGFSFASKPLTLAAKSAGPVGYSPHLLNVSGTNTWPGAITFDFGGSQYNLRSDAGSLTVSGQISGGVTTGLRQLNLLGAATGKVSGNIVNGSATVSVQKSDPGTWTISGNNTFSGGVGISAGQLNLNSATALGAVAGTFTVAGGSIDNTTGGALTLANNNPQSWSGDFTFVGSQNLNLGTGAITLTGNRTLTVGANTLTVGGVISGTGVGLTVTGGGTLTLTASNSFTGNTTVAAGTLALTGIGALATSPVLTVASNATLDVTGRADGTLTLAQNQILAGGGTVNGRLVAGTNATLAPAAVQILTVTSNVVLQAGTTNVFNLFDANDVAGSGFSSLNLGGSLTLPAATNPPVTICLVSLADGVNAGAATNFSYDTGYTWPLATVAGAFTNFSPNGFFVNTAQFSNDLAGGVFSVATNAGSLNLQFTSDRPPVAGTAVFIISPGQPLQISISNLLANFASDPDGDAVILTGLGASANGATITTNATTIFYTPANSGGDTFSYTIQDARPYRAGDTVRTAQGQIQIAVSGGAWSGTSATAGAFTAQFSGVPGATYVVQWSSNLMNWVDVATNALPLNGNGSFSFTTNQPPSPSFLRTRVAN